MTTRMAEQQRIPGQARENNERLGDRAYDSEFARLPDSETHANTVPGGGPHGTVSGGSKNVPVMVIVAGFVVTFAGFGLGPIAIVAGLALILAGAIFAAVRSTTTGGLLGKGSGTTRIPRS